MKLRNSRSGGKGRTFKPEALRLEDRLVPGEVLSTALNWGLCSFALPVLLAQESASVPQPAAGDVGQSAGANASSWNDNDCTARALCENNDALGDSSGTTQVNLSTSSGEFQAPSVRTETRDQVFESLGLDLGDDFGTLPTMDMTSNRMDFSAPANDDAFFQGAALSSAMSSSAPAAASNLSAPGMGGPTQSPPIGATASTTSSAAPVATGAMADGGAMATPLQAVHAVAAPNQRGRGNVVTAAAPYTPTQIKQAYGFNLVANKGAGQTIYIIDAYNDPNIAKDLQTFDTTFGLPVANLTVHTMSNHIQNNVNWGFEESLDVQWAHAIAPQANLVLVEAASSSYTNLFAAVDWATNNGARIVSMSWGGGDFSGEAGYDSHFNHSGVTYIASAGDTGGVVEYPAASPYVLSVGGTSLSIDTSGNYVSETTWSAGGGGASVGESEPGYQTSYGISLNGRGTPDVSYDGDPNTGFYVYDTYTNHPGWYEVGGTSAGAPQWAALIALADQSRATPLSTNNLTSRIEYNAAASAVYANNYHDVTAGSNGYSAGTGYDLATGLGSPRADNLIPWLIANN
jgi:hypothetical protein